MRQFRAPLGIVIIIISLMAPGVVLAAFPPVQFVAVRSPVPHGGQGLVGIHTSSTTYCTITVVYKSGPSHATGLEPRISDSKGNIAWVWKIGTRTTPGIWPIIVECGRGEITRIRTTFEVI